MEGGIREGLIVATTWRRCTRGVGDKAGHDGFECKVKVRLV